MSSLKYKLFLYIKLWNPLWGLVKIRILTSSGCLKSCITYHRIAIPEKIFHIYSYIKLWTPTEAQELPGVTVRKIENRNFNHNYCIVKSLLNAFKFLNDIFNHVIISYYVKSDCPSWPHIFSFSFYLNYLSQYMYENENSHFKNIESLLP